VVFTDVDLRRGITDERKLPPWPVGRSAYRGVGWLRFHGRRAGEPTSCLKVASGETLHLPSAGTHRGHYGTLGPPGIGFTLTLELATALEHALGELGSD